MSRRKTRQGSTRFYRDRDAHERLAIVRALTATTRTIWNVTAAAKRLGLPLSTLKYKMKRLKIRRGRA